VGRNSEEGQHLRRGWPLQSLPARGSRPHRLRVHSQATPEPAWHRRARAQRQRARDLIRAVKASELLSEHHGTAKCERQMAPPKSQPVAPGSGSGPSAKTHWLCHGCPGSGGCGYYVPRGGIACNSCGHVPPASVSAKRAKAEQPRPQAKEKAAPKGDGSGGAKLKEALAAKEKAEAKVKTEAKASAALRERIKTLEAGVPATPAAAASSMEVDAEHPAAATLDSAVADAKAALDDFKGLSARVQQCVPDFQQQLVRRQEEYDAALESRRSANPLKQQLNVAEQWHTRVSKRLAAAKTAVEAKQAERAEVEEAIVKLATSVTELDAEVAKATAKVAELSLKITTERVGAVPAVGGLQAGEASVAAALDMVSRAFAEEKWAEREAMFAQREAEHERAIAQLQGLVAEATVPEASASEVAPSDLGSVEDLEDDAAWHQVERGSRQKVLARQKRLLAKEVRSSLGGIANLAKVSATASPFKK
jgi:hypothetical protein